MPTSAPSTWTLEHIMAELESMGTAQNRKVYPRHGVQGPMFGVSYGNLEKLRKAIRKDQALAEALWKTGNHDARVLATKIADPKTITPATLDAWATDLDNYVLTDAFTALVGKTPHLREKFDAWRNSESECLGQVAWGLVTTAASKSKPWDDAELGAFIDDIEAQIHGRQNRVRYSMNMALIAIGGSREALYENARAAAERIGTVEVDHGETGCVTPDMVPYMEKMWARKRAKAKK